MDKLLENPEMQPGETKKQWIPRCVKYLMDHEGLSQDHALGKCYGMWKSKHPNTNDAEWIEILNQEHTFTCDAEFKVQEQDIKCECAVCTGQTVENDKPHITATKKRMVAIVGNRFMNGGFFSYELLKDMYKQWENTLHDINHMGTTRNPTTDHRQDITYFVGYHSNAILDEDNKSVSMDINIVDETRFASAWKGFIKLCEQAGKIPNVSVTYWGNRKFVRASELPEGVDYQSEGYTKDDYVPYLTNAYPVAVSTVLLGRCNDKHGCGIGNTCSWGNKQKENNVEFEHKIQEQIQRIKTLQEKLKHD